MHYLEKRHVEKQDERTAKELSIYFKKTEWYKVPTENGFIRFENEDKKASLIKDKLTGMCSLTVISSDPLLKPSTFHQPSIAGIAAALKSNKRHDISWFAKRAV